MTMVFHNFSSLSSRPLCLIESNEQKKKIKYKTLLEVACGGGDIVPILTVKYTGTW